MLNWTTNEKGILASDVLNGLIIFEVEQSANGRWQSYVRGAHTFQLSFEDVVNNNSELKGFESQQEAREAAEDWWKYELLNLKTT